jgi:zinc transporter, ZIP family
MENLALVLLYALLPAAGNIAGALLAESVKPPRWVIGASLHGAAGIAIALVSIELMPRILGAVPIWVMISGFLAGAAASYYLARGVSLIRSRASGANFRAWMVYVAVSADLFSDGLMTGIGSAAALKLGLFLAASQFLANVPGGFAAGANLRANKAPPRQRILAAAFLFAPALVSCLIGYALLKNAVPGLQYGALAFVVGILLLATIEDMIPEGDAPRPPRWSSSLAFALGFAALALLDQLKAVTTENGAEETQSEADIRRQAD